MTTSAVARDPARPWRAVTVAGLAVVYFAAAKLGLSLAFVNPSATAVWPPTGIALAAFLLLGARAWPAIFVGAFVANITTAGSIVTSLGIAGGNTVEGLLGAFLVERFAAGRQAFARPRNTFRFALLAAAVSTVVSATLGVTSLALGGFARWADFGHIWLTWWLGDGAGSLVVTPVVLLWAENPRIGWTRRQAVEAAALLACLLLVGLLVFGGQFPNAAKNYPLEFLCIPILLWAAFRFGARETATVILLLSVIAIRGTLRGYGPFARETQNESLLLLQAFIAVIAVTKLIVAAVVTERRRMEGHLRDLAVRDPLTGLANYRHLMVALEAEIRRSQRTQRGFAVLLLDVDGLKRINDRHGHLVGSRALCRLAEVLHTSCRAVDTAARYGGDEFALVLPETDEAAAQQVALRVGERLAEDVEAPRIKASFGVAMFPRDGATAEAILSGADRALYTMKTSGARAR
ncbi:MAG TPA: MASE1 domain-containing protein [Gemmatimonadales bacterium]|jgi:diguanylate cyclase (GGDEF)-like protein|nr:MASE1 domain-containing protein [Gemmatimonadales bacterium]